MAPPQVFKQVWAIADERTTITCLHAAGQIQPIGQPFETLSGNFDRPPFHDHCRSVSVPWVGGMVNDQRKKANAELLKRPLKERRIGPNGEIGGRLPPRPRSKIARGGAFDDVTSTPMVSATDVPLSAAEREQLSRLIGPLRDGKIDLEDVPDRLVIHAIDNAPGRFGLSPNGIAGQSENWWVSDLVKKQEYVLKRADLPTGSIDEVLVSRLWEGLGEAWSQTRWAGAPGGRGWTIGVHAEDAVRTQFPKFRLRGPGVSNDKVAPLVKKMSDTDDMLRIVMNDFVTDQFDRKSANWLMMVDDTGKLKPVPIDNGQCLMGFRGHTRIDLSQQARIAIRSLGEYVDKSGFTAKGFIRGTREVARTKPEKVVAAYDDFLTRLKAIDLKAIEDDLVKGLNSGEVAAVEEKIDLIRARIEVLEEEREAILKELGVQDARLLSRSTVVEQSSEATEAVKALAAGVKSGIASETRIVGSRVSRVRFVDGSEAIMRREPGWEEIYAQPIGDVMGAPIAPTVYDREADIMYSVIVEGRTGGAADFPFDEFKKYAKTEDGQRAALYDYVTQQLDRHKENWMVGARADGSVRITLIDQEYCLRTGADVSQVNSPFTSEWIGKRFDKNVLDDARRALDAVEEAMKGETNTGRTNLTLAWNLASHRLRMLERGGTIARAEVVNPGMFR